MQEYEERYRETGGKGKADTRGCLVRELIQALKTAAMASGRDLNWTNSLFKKVCPVAKPFSCSEYQLQKITNYYANHKTVEADGLESLGALALGQDRSVQCVVFIKKQEEIHQQISEMTDAKRGSPGYLKFYQTATTQVIQDMDDEEYEEMEKISDEWRSKGPPENVKRE